MECLEFSGKTPAPSSEGRGRRPDETSDAVLPASSSSARFCRLFRVWGLGLGFWPPCAVFFSLSCYLSYRASGGLSGQSPKAQYSCRSHACGLKMSQCLLLFFVWQRFSTCRLKPVVRVRERERLKPVLQFEPADNQGFVSCTKR